MIKQYITGSTGTQITFGTLHGVMVCEPYTQPIQIFSVPGLIGIGQLLDYRKERHLSCDMRAHGYATYADLSDALELLDSYNQTLTGDVVVSGSLNFTYENCTFLHFARQAPKYDGTGNHDWWIEGRLHWIQRAPNT